MTNQMVKGNTAVIIGAMYAGCDCFFGYPITPASEILHEASKYFPMVNRNFVQAESEEASINMIYGGASTGHRVMTASSGPGISLMQEGFTYLAGAELPAVIVDIMRAGPGLGNIGPEQGEELYYNRNKMYPYNFNQTNLPTSDFATDSGTKKTTITSSGANKIKQNDATASFNVMPYWGESSFTLTVINDFTVETANGTTYTVKAGKYTDIPQEGLNLFDDKAKDYFDSHSTEQEDSDSSGIDWVQSGTINTSVADSKLNQSSSVIKFEASNGGTLKNGAYTAKAIYCDFGNTVKGNNATLKGDAISIGANKLDGSGANNGLFINTYGGYSSNNGASQKLKIQINDIKDMLYKR